MGDLLSAEGRETHRRGRKRRKNVGNIYIILPECQEALNMIKRLIDEKGHEIMPFSLSAWRQIVSSAYRMNVSGTDILNFQKIYQRLDQRDYYGVFDFAADVQLTFK
ncbi:hypothetical protein C1H46_031467 [Malus baccata]|uniref:Uncharacterized protein n=1 Tax=Malus baccata TaxID=106549 RepID=A0A540L8Y3_MALBA|nr:hypothetical protein C1H46_031467 [Malus baccata]